MGPRVFLGVERRGRGEKMPETAPIINLTVVD